MLKSSTGLSFAAVLVVAVLLVYGTVFAGNKPAPRITFPLLDGRQLALSELAGKPVLVTFWATTCIECRKEMPDLITLYNQLSPKGFEMIAVAMPYDPPNRVLELSERMRIPYPIAIDIEGKAVSAFGDIPGTPAAFLISPEGRIVMRHTGLLDINALRSEISAMLPECTEQHTLSAACSG